MNGDACDWQPLSDAVQIDGMFTLAPHRPLVDWLLSRMSSGAVRMVPRPHLHR